MYYNSYRKISIRIPEYLNNDLDNFIHDNDGVISKNSFILDAIRKTLKYYSEYTDNINMLSNQIQELQNQIQELQNQVQNFQDSR